MNRRVCVCVGSIIWFGMLTGGASGQSSIATPGTRAGGAGIDTSIKNAPDPAPYADKIQQFVTDQVKQIAGNDPALQKAARERLIAECTPGSMDSYFDLYTQKVDAAVEAELTPSAEHPLDSLPVRLNLAVMVEEVARVAKNNANLEGAVLKLIDDPSDPIALWGMKAAKPVIAFVVSQPNGGSDKLVAAIFPAVKKHVKSGYVTEEAYHALTPDVRQPGSAVIPTVIGPILDILEFRVSQYQAGIPDNPEAENAIANFLWRNYAKAAPADQQRIVQQLVNLITCAGAQAQFANKAQLEQISNALKIAAQALQIIVDPQSNLHLQTLAPLVNLLAGAPGRMILDRTKPVYDELKQQPSLAFLQAPPAVTPATMPSTQPDGVAAGH